MKPNHGVVFYSTAKDSTHGLSNKPVTRTAAHSKQKYTAYLISTHMK
jgi:hypothetical protein